MKHQKFKELLELNILGELCTQEEIDLQNHLFECEECNYEYNQLKKIYSLVTGTKPFQPSETDIVNARIRLFNTINVQDETVNSDSKFKNLIKSLFKNNYTIAFGSTILIVIGFFIGYLIFSDSNSSKRLVENSINLDKVRSGELQIANINLPEKFATEKIFEFKLGEENYQSYEGGIGDVTVQKLLATSLIKSNNSGFKIKTARTVAELVHSNFVLDNEIKDAFIFAVKNDLNPGVRKEAIKALLNFPYDKQVRDALLFTLQYDDNASNRMEAISSLLTMKFEEDHVDQNLKSKLEKSLVQEENEVIKFKTAKYLLGDK